MRLGAALWVAAVGVLTMALGGCASAPQAYGLQPATSRPLHARGTLAIPQPDAAPPLDSDLIVVRESGDRLSSLPGGQWAARLTRLVQNRLIQSFENAGLAGSVRTDGAPADRRLMLDIRRFDIEAPTHEARVEIAARLVAESSGRTVEAKIFSASQPVADIAGAEPALALDRAFGQVSRQIVVWAATGR
jgi:cholesterol transport system auxiliary component